MAKAKGGAPARVASATLSNGSKVSGPPAVVARLVAKHGEAKPPRAAATKPAKSDDEK